MSLCPAEKPLDEWKAYHILLRVLAGVSHLAMYVDCRRCANQAKTLYHDTYLVSEFARSENIQDDAQICSRISIS